MSAFKLLTVVVTGITIGYIASRTAKRTVDELDSTYAITSIDFDVNNRPVRFTLKVTKHTKSGALRFSKSDEFHIQWEGDVAIIPTKWCDELGVAMESDFGWHKENGYVIEAVADCVRMFKA